MDAERLAAILLDLLRLDRHHPELAHTTVMTIAQSGLASNMSGFVVRDEMNGRQYVIHVTEQPPG